MRASVQAIWRHLLQDGHPNTEHGAYHQNKCYCSSHGHSSHPILAAR